MRIALAQVPPVLRDVEAALARIDELAHRAAADGADLVVFPEMFLTGYAIGAGPVSALAQAADGPAAGAVGRVAAKHGLGVVYGFPELAGGQGTGGRVFNSANFIGDDGALLATYRKLHLFGEVDRAQFSAGQARPPVVRWRGWRVGLGICYDIEFPEFARMLADDAADLVCVPTANMVGFEQVQEILLPARAYENQMFVAYANYVGVDKGFTYNGWSVVVAPDGAVVARGSVGTGDELVIADIGLRSLQDAREQASYLHDRRTDVYG